MDRQGAEGEAVQGRPGTGTLDHRGASRNASAANCRRINAMSSSSRWRPDCGSPMCVGLEWSHVNLDTGHAWVDADQSKNRRPIAVPLNATALEVLRRQIGKHPRAGVYVSREADWRGPTRRRGERRLKRAGIENFRWHDMRHTWASWHRQSGTPTHELQRLGGWRSSVMVERYAHLGARPSRESSQPARFAARWLRFGYAGEGS